MTTKVKHGNLILNMAKCNFNDFYRRLFADLVRIVISDGRTDTATAFTAFLWLILLACKLVTIIIDLSFKECRRVSIGCVFENIPRPYQEVFCFVLFIGKPVSIVICWMRSILIVLKY